MKYILLNLLWILSGIGLVIYPLILIANVMSFGAPKSSATAIHNFTIKKLLFKAALIITTLFPVIYYVSYRMSKGFYESENSIWAFIVMIPCLLISASVMWILRYKKRTK